MFCVFEQGLPVEGTGGGAHAACVFFGTGAGGGLWGAPEVVVVFEQTEDLSLVLASVDFIRYALKEFYEESIEVFPPASEEFLKVSVLYGKGHPNWLVKRNEVSEETHYWFKGYHIVGNLNLRRYFGNSYIMVSLYW